MICTLALGALMLLGAAQGQGLWAVADDAGSGADAPHHPERALRIEPEVAYDGAIDAIGDVDRYALDVDEPTTAEVRVVGAGQCFKLLDPNQETILHDCAIIGSQYLAASVRLEETGRYLLDFSDHDVGPYRFSVGLDGSAPYLLVALEQNDAGTGGDAPNMPVSTVRLNDLDVTRGHLISYEDPRDVYAFEVPNGTFVEIEVGPSLTTEPCFQFLDPEGDPYWINRGGDKEYGSYCSVQGGAYNMTTDRDGVWFVDMNHGVVVDGSFVSVLRYDLSINWVLPEETAGDAEPGDQDDSREAGKEPDAAQDEDGAVEDKLTQGEAPERAAPVVQQVDTKVAPGPVGPWDLVGALGMTGLVAAALSNRTVRRVLTWLPLAVVYGTTRAVGDNRVRERIRHLVEQSPGITTRELQEGAGVARGTVLYHLRRLEQAECVRGYRHGRARTWFSVNALRDVDPRAASLLQGSPTSRRLFREIRAHPGIAQHELVAHFPRAQSSVAYHARRLEEAGLIESERRGRLVHYRVAGQ